jgi:hypothetical protein
VMEQGRLVEIKESSSPLATLMDVAQAVSAHAG